VRNGAQWNEMERNGVKGRKLPGPTPKAGYGIFSVGFSQIKVVKKYIMEQEKHHQRVSFQDEFRKLLRRYEIEFNERYVWD
jgi:putative transposase